MRHVSRAHRVAPDCLFERINMDPKTQIRDIDTKHQLADLLTKGNFTRDEWNNLLHLINVSHFSSNCCAQNARLWQNYSLWRWTWLPLSRQIPHPWAIRLRRRARGYAKHLQGNLTRGPEEISNPTQRRALKESWEIHTLACWWLKQRRNLTRQMKVRIMGNFSILNPGAIHRKEVTKKPVASWNSRNSESSTTGNRKWPHNFHVSSNHTTS